MLNCLRRMKTRIQNFVNMDSFVLIYVCVNYLSIFSFSFFYPFLLLYLNLNKDNDYQTESQLYHQINFKHFYLQDFYFNKKSILFLNGILFILVFVRAYLTFLNVNNNILRSCKQRYKMYFNEFSLETILTK